MYAEGAGQLPNHNDLRPSRTTTISEAPSDPIPSPFCPFTVWPSHLAAPSGTFLHLHNCSTLSLAPCCALLPQYPRRYSLSQQVLLPHLCPLRVPPWTPWGSQGCLPPPASRPKGPSPPGSVGPRRKPHSPSRGRAFSLRRLPGLPRGEAPPPGHLTEADPPPTEPRALVECWTQAAAAAATTAAAVAAQGLRGRGERPSSLPPLRRLGILTAPPLYPTSQGPVTSPGRARRPGPEWRGCSPRALLRAPQFRPPSCTPYPSCCSPHSPVRCPALV